ncbi:hypothetical protein WJX74_006484 [Apatococcus lobatus]|uniref:Glutaredoxin-like protein n=1 Tax=Apatococcus lobatus TaxID=904363 RepID=A0AAW1RDL6_9CHLO
MLQCWLCRQFRSLSSQGALQRAVEDMQHKCPYAGQPLRWLQPRVSQPHRLQRLSGAVLRPQAQLKLVLYSKPGCHLCEGLEEKVRAVIARAEFLPSKLSGADLEVRDIRTKPDWMAAYEYSIPVLTKVSEDGHPEKKIPRAPPKMTAERLARHIEEAL